jgi:hypothetical protein
MEEVLGNLKEKPGRTSSGTVQTWIEKRSSTALCLTITMYDLEV